jgi:hypothetical protein
VGSCFLDYNNYTFRAPSLPCALALSRGQRLLVYTVFPCPEDALCFPIPPAIAAPQPEAKYPSPGRKSFIHLISQRPANPKHACFPKSMSVKSSRAFWSRGGLRRGRECRHVGGSHLWKRSLHTENKVRDPCWPRVSQRLTGTMVNQFYLNFYSLTTPESSLVNTELFTSLKICFQFSFTQSHLIT